MVPENNLDQVVVQRIAHLANQEQEAVKSSRVVAMLSEQGLELVGMSEGELAVFLIGVVDPTVVPAGGLKLVVELLFPLLMFSLEVRDLFREGFRRFGALGGLSERQLRCFRSVTVR